MSIDALWSVQFVSEFENYGGGVVVLMKGKVMGGDSQYTFLGNYEITGDTFTTSARISLFNGSPNSIFGPLQSFTAKLSGKYNDKRMDLEGTVGDYQMRALLVRRAELP